MIDVCFANLALYNEGNLASEWLTFPTDEASFQKIIDNLLQDNTDDLLFIKDCDTPNIPELGSYITRYSNIEEINYLASLLNKLDVDDLEKYNACLSTNNEGYPSIDKAINVLTNLDCFYFRDDIFDNTDLGEDFVYDSGIFDTESIGYLTNFIDYEALGSNIRRNENGEFVTSGYVVQESEYKEIYKGLYQLPEEARIFSYVDHKSIEYLKNTELGTEENYNNIDGVRNNITPEKDESKGKPSLLGELKETKEAVKEATAKTDKEARPPSKEEDCR